MRWKATDHLQELSFSSLETISTSLKKYNFENEEIQLGDDKLNAVTTFKYLGSIIDSNGGAERGINNRVKLAWMKWKQLTGVLCDKKVPIIDGHQTERQGV